MNQRIRVLQELGEEFERAITHVPVDRPRASGAPATRRVVRSRLRRVVGVATRRIRFGHIALGLAVIVPVAIVIGALAVLGRSARASDVAGRAGAGVAKTGTLVAHAADPHGGLPWGVREVRTSNGNACLQVGRLKSGVIGVLGQDGAYANDHEFHSMSLTSSPSGGLNCGLLDRNANAFLNITDPAAIASGYGDAAPNGGAHGAAAKVKLCPKSSSSGRIDTSVSPPCPHGDLRALAYGLLGPDAVNITYINADGRPVTEPTAGPDGAYLIVRPCDSRAVNRPACASFGSLGPLLQPGVITAVTYSNGRVCHLPAPTSHRRVANASCPAVGYVAPPFPHVTSAQLAAPVSARVLPAKHYCTSTGHNIVGCREVVLDVAFTARVAVTSANSYYEAVVNMPPRHYTPGARRGCRGSTSTLSTQVNIRTGQQVHWRDDEGCSPKDCVGNTINITVAFVPNSNLGLNGVGSSRLASPGRGAIIVGKTSVRHP